MARPRSGLRHGVSGAAAGGLPLEARHVLRAAMTRAPSPPPTAALKRAGHAPMCWVRAPAPTVPAAIPSSSAATIHIVEGRSVVGGWNPTRQVPVTRSTPAVITPRRGEFAGSRSRSRSRSREERSADLGHFSEDRLQSVGAVHQILGYRPCPQGPDAGHDGPSRSHASTPNRPSRMARGHRMIFRSSHNPRGSRGGRTCSQPGPPHDRQTGHRPRPDSTREAVAGRPSAGSSQMVAIRPA